MKLFITAFLQVFFVSANIYMIANNHIIGIAACSFIVSYFWTINVKKISISNKKERILYSSGAMTGSVFGFVISSFVDPWLTAIIKLYAIPKTNIMKPKNIKEFKELILRYESITLEEIKKHQMKPEFMRAGCFNLSGLTGFGNPDTCTLCKAVDSDCYECAWHDTSNYFTSGADCDSGNNEQTFMNIAFAETPQELKAAYKARANHMRNILKEYYENNTQETNN